MSIRTTVTLDEDVIVRLKDVSVRQGRSFKETLNEMIRKGLQADEAMRKAMRPFKIKPILYATPKPGINYDCTSELLALDDEVR